MTAGQSRVQEPVVHASSGSDQLPRHFPALDGARGVAAMAVVVSHCANAGFFPRILGEGTGQMGVLLFFLLSGFLMAFLYGQRPFTNEQVLRYATHRIARVFPLFYLVIALSLIVGAEGPIRFFDLSGGEWLKPVALVTGTSVLWTIPVEVQYYIVFLLIWAAAKRFPLGVWIAAGFAGQLLVLALLRLCVRGNQFLPYWFHAFFLGTIAGYLLHRHAKAFLTATRAPALQVLGWIILLMIPLSLPELRRIAGFPMLPNFIDPITFGMPVLIFLAALGSLGPFRYLALPVFTRLGAVSYAIYLLHKPVMWSLEPWLAGRVPDLALGLAIVALSILVAAVSTYGFERPVQKLLKRHGAKLSRRLA
ncbi:acyltransferase family protein [Novosphingobium mangrovi (ex Hu et al. 2023)]|uniref:Acyltransferase n=1 Tax=Novosphingobium mangrovi (ex Hu et al. 2023) TaxID=2930094 RepID=A0ABT0AHM1_9SPHN|nr:acyltransferase [Novosphingobium mangrovi (ex Hu et al. 2023)]MCJ1962706.1 acyltransferase [Novosphingobium mangrovi (ex Hu et al. 2023)]